MFATNLNGASGLFTSNLEQYLATSYDIIGIILTVRKESAKHHILLNHSQVRVCEVQRNTLNKKRNNAVRAMRFGIVRKVSLTDLRRLCTALTQCSIISPG